MRSRSSSMALLVACALAAIGLVAAPAGADVDAGAEAAFVSQTNALRASRGLPPVAVHGALVAKARGWAQHMADVGGISHSNLPDGAPQEWQRLGENVGRGPTVDAIHQALVASPSHLANLTDPGFRYVGVGVVSANGTLYVSEVFMETASQPAPMPSATAGTPTSQPRTRPATPAPQVAPAVVPAPPPRTYTFRSYRFV
ncbi:MAG: CAP domain-containing protein [Actinobacteria bacterium]|nr:CAP domain-containing protein [Actinomycetota bacterium]